MRRMSDYRFGLEIMSFDMFLLSFLIRDNNRVTNKIIFYLSNVKVTFISDTCLNIYLYRCAYFEVISGDYVNIIAKGLGKSHVNSCF